MKETLQTLAIDPEHTHSVERLLSRFQLPNLRTEFDICELCLALRDKDMLPALVFHLNQFDLIEVFRELLGKSRAVCISRY